MPALTPRDFENNWSLAGSRKSTLSGLAGADAELKNRLNFSENLDPEYDYGLKAYNLGSKSAQIAQESALNSSQNVINDALAQLQANNQQQQQGNGIGSGVGLNNGDGSPRLKAIMRALRSQESGGNYGAVNKDSGALGAYQVMPSNIAGEGRGWDQEALGRDITPQQFLASKKLQNQVARYKFGSYLKKHGLQGALSAWYSGSPTRWNEKTPQGDYPSVRDYVLQTIARLGK